MQIMTRFSFVHWVRQRLQRLFGAAAQKPAQPVVVYTLDSGFGGYFIAKALEKMVLRHVLPRHHVKIQIQHFGDTANVPYGDKTPEQVTTLMSGHIAAAFNQGAHTVVVACNTAATQEKAVRQALAKTHPQRQNDVLFLLDATVQHLRAYATHRLRHRSRVHFVFMATPLTINSGVYAQALAQACGGVCQLGSVQKYADQQASDGRAITSFTRHDVLTLPSGKEIHIYNLAPAAWVDLVEAGVNLRVRHHTVQRDVARVLALLPANTMPDAVGEFCTHYPVLHGQIAAAMREQGVTQTVYIQQGVLMGDALLKHWQSTCVWPKAQNVSARHIAAARPVLTLSGNNSAATLQAVRTMYPHDPLPEVQHAITPAGGSPSFSSRRSSEA